MWLSLTSVLTLHRTFLGISYNTKKKHILKHFILRSYFLALASRSAFLCAATANCFLVLKLCLFENLWFFRNLASIWNVSFYNRRFISLPFRHLQKWQISLTPKVDSCKNFFGFLMPFLCALRSVIELIL